MTDDIRRSNFSDATRDVEISCPHCHNKDVPGCASIFERQPDGHLACSICSKLFYPTSWAYRMTQEQLAKDKDKK